jgi:glycosyltransferase involved in cell wall biosynthesis
MPPRIVAAIWGAPLEPTTWSGLSRYLFEALVRAGALEAAVDTTPGRLLDLFAYATTIAPNKIDWRTRYEHSAVARWGMSHAGGRRVRAANPHPEALLQVGAWYDFTGIQGLEPRVRCSYHDGNLARYLDNPDCRLDRDSPQIKRALRFEKKVYDGLDLIMPMSDWLRGSFMSDFEQSPDKVVTVGAGANLQRIPDAPARDVQPGRARFLFVGGDFQRKGGPELLDAFAHVRSQQPDAELWLVGPSERSVPSRPGVRLHGFVRRDTPEGESEIDRLYREATAFVMPSRYEPFGVALLEAMAYGLPCVAADTCAMPEIVVHGSTGLVAPVGDAATLAQHLGTLAENPELGVQMGAAGRKRFLDRYTWDAVARRMIDAIGARLTPGAASSRSKIASAMAGPSAEM